VTPSADAAAGAGAGTGAGAGAKAGHASGAGPKAGQASDAGGWLELAVEADLEAVEPVSEILGRVASGGTTVEPAFDLVDEGLGARVDVTRPAIVRTRVVHEEDWAAAWKAHFPVLRVGRRLVIRPTWRRHHRQPDDVVLALDPGMAFGTGLHPTTRLCLAALESAADRGVVDGARVLDVGCGSGILAIAAIRLGAARALGVDTDPIAVEATMANARRNRVTRRVAARAGSVPSGESPFDVILANLIAGVLVPLARPLHDELRPGGLLLASGIFIDREAEVRDAFETAGLRVIGRSEDGDWVAIDAIRPVRPA